MTYVFYGDSDKGHYTYYGKISKTMFISQIKR